MENLLAGLDLLWGWSNILLVVVGLTVGFVVGVLPGFSGANAAAIILPFSIGLSIEGALLLMVGIYAGASFAGAVPAILMNVPGTASAAATALDGYPMARQGNAELAIGVARMASAVGGVIAIAIVLTVIGPISQLALLFGAREMFIVAAFGLMIIAAVIGDDVWKGLLAGLLGLLIAAMSANPMTAQTRWTLGFIELYETVPFIPALIGLFAFTEMFSWISSGRDRLIQKAAAAPPSSSLREALARLKDGILTALSYPKTLLRSALLGTFVGSIPGTGQVVGTFLSYGIAKRTSRRPEQFGKGTPEGVVASEATDTAVTAGTLVPTLTLGIPGSGTAAVMLAALYLHGVQPGPRVMVTHGGEVYAVLLGLLVACVLILPIGVLLASPLVHVTRLRPSILFPAVIVLSSVGAFAVRSSMFDVGLALAFGFLGFGMRLSGYPVVPFVLGLILGPMAENNFLRALRLGRNDLGYFFASTSARVLWAMLALTIAYTVVRWLRSRRQRTRERVS